MLKMVLKEASFLRWLLPHIQSSQDARSSIQSELKSLKEVYSSVTVLHLADEQISLLACFWQLKELLWRNMNEMQWIWQRNRCLYSAVHLAEFFCIVIMHMAISLLHLFNFILVSWQNNKVCFNYADHLTMFL